MVNNWKENQDYLFDNGTEWKGFPFVAPQQEVGVANNPANKTSKQPLTKEEKKANRQAMFGSLLTTATDVTGSILATKQAKEATKQAQEATKQAQVFSLQGGFGNTPVVQKKDNTLPIVIGVVGFIAVAATAIIIIKNKK